MKMIKNKVLTLLLFTFAFFVVHDYVVQDLHQSIKSELSHKVCDKSELQCKVHDTIHNIFNFNLIDEVFLQIKPLDTPPSSILFALSSTIDSVPQRPPLS